MYLMCGPRQFFFFQCGPETPKGWTPLEGFEFLSSDGVVIEQGVSVGRQPVSMLSLGAGSGGHCGPVYPVP